METLEAIEARRAVKAYDPEHVMPEEDLARLLELARMAPTSFNIQNWRFVVVRDKALRAQIREAAWNQAQVTDASVLFILCADLRAWAHDPARYWRNAPKPVQDFLVPAIGPFYEGKPELQRDEAMRSVGIAAQTIMLAAKSMGYESCPMIGFDPEAVGRLINLPEDHVIGMFVVVGKGIKPANPRGGDIPAEEAIIYDRFA